MHPDPELLAILQRAFPGSALCAYDALGGGISARAVVAEVALADGATTKVVVRRPQQATHEAALAVVHREHAALTLCSAAGIPVPNPRHLDDAGAALVLDYVEGAPDLAPAALDDALRQAATQLVRIHRVALPSGGSPLPSNHDFVGDVLTHPPPLLDVLLDEATVRAELARHWPWPQHNGDALLHGDYWPGNVLWRHGQLVAVLDWEEAAIGDPLADIALARLDVLWAFGEAAMQVFTQHYRDQHALDWRNLPLWDLRVALRPMSNLARWAPAYVGSPICRPDINEQTMRDGHRRFVAQALRDLHERPCSLEPTPVLASSSLS
jgi:aminoglycoside phosphotransferase (APT) family kinase protein